MEFPSALKPSFTLAVLACLGLAASPKSADPATVTATFVVSTTVETTCVTSATPLEFGPYLGISEADSTGTITVHCSDLAPYNVGLNAGVSTGATVSTRAMTGPASALLHYSLYSDSARTVNWGNTVGTDTVAGVGTGIAQTITVYGRVPAGQGPAAGAYTDTITATVTY